VCEVIDYLLNKLSKKSMHVISKDEI